MVVVDGGRQITVRLRPTEAADFEVARALIAPQFPGAVRDADVVRIMMAEFLKAHLGGRS